MTYQDILLDLLKNTSNLSSGDYSELQTLAASIYANQVAEDLRGKILKCVRPVMPYPIDELNQIWLKREILRIEITLP